MRQSRDWTYVVAIIALIFGLWLILQLVSGILAIIIKLFFPILILLMVVQIVQRHRNRKPYR